MKKLLPLILIAIVFYSCRKINTQNNSTNSLSGIWIFKSQQINDNYGNPQLGISARSDSQQAIFNNNNTISYTYETVTPSENYDHWVTGNGVYNYVSDSLFTVNPVDDTAFLKLVYGYYDGLYTNTGIPVLQINFETYQWPHGDTVFIKYLKNDSLVLQNNDSKYGFDGVYTVFTHQ